MSVTVPSTQPISAEGYEPVSQFGALLIELAGPWLTLHLAWVLDAIGVVIDPIATIVQDVGVDDGITPTVGTYFNGELVTEGFQPGYGALLNPLTCPVDDLPYCAQFAGVSLPAGIDEAGARSMILAESGINRGTDGAVLAAANRFLPEGQSATLLRRTYADGTPHAGWFVLIVPSGEISSGATWAGSTYPWADASGSWLGGDQVAALVAAVDAVKLGGLMWTLVLSNGSTWSQATKTWAAETATWAQTANSANAV